MRALVKACAALAIVGIFAGSAHAATVVVQANAGRPIVSFGTTSWANTSSVAAWSVIDARSITKNTAGAGNWATPIPITGTNQNWTAVAFGTGAGLSNRICAYTSGGAFSGCGASATSNNPSTVFVPADGSARCNTTINGPGQLNADILDHIKANN